MDAEDFPNETLKVCYERLLGQRELMLNGLQEQFHATHQRVALVDSLILGAMTYLHTVAANEEAFKKVFGSDYKIFDKFARDYVDTIALFARQPPSSVKASRA